MNKNFLTQFWKCVANQDCEKLNFFFTDNAIIQWPNTNEQFNVAEFILATCEYPDNWETEIEKIIENDLDVVTITKVSNRTKKKSLYANSYFTFDQGKIKKLIEYWSDNQLAPVWRQNLNIGKKIF